MRAALLVRCRSEAAPTRDPNLSPGLVGVMGSWLRGKTTDAILRVTAGRHALITPITVQWVPPKLLKR